MGTPGREADRQSFRCGNARAPGAGGVRSPLRGKPFTVALDIASAGAATLTITSGVVAFLTFLSSFNPQVSLNAEFGAQLGRFLLDTELGRSWLITVILASVVTVLAFAVRSNGAVMFTTVLAIISLIPMATQGHSGELANHDPAVMSLVLHVISAAIWLGGLILLVAARPISSPHELENLLRRYSTVALIAFIGVAVSGFARALTALGRWKTWPHRTASSSSQRSARFWSWASSVPPTAADSSQRPTRAVAPSG